MVENTSTENWESKVISLAKSSLVLSALSIILGPITFIPGIICSHAARRLANNHEINSSSMFLWISLIFAYSMGAIMTFLIIIVLFSVFEK